MRIYAETNFVLELALLQEQRLPCRDLVELCEAGHATLILPALSFSEPYETLGRRRLERRRLKEALDAQLRQLERTEDYRELLAGFRSVTALLTESGDEEARRLEKVRDRLLAVARLAQLDADVLHLAAECRRRHDLSAQDALIYASVLGDLRREPADESCFLTRDRQGFDDIDIAKELAAEGCRLIHGFEHGYGFVHSRLNLGGGDDLP